MAQIAHRISVNAGVRFGKPVIEGTRVPVAVVVGAIAAGDSLEEVAREYSITVEDVRAALSYAAKRLDEEAIRVPR
jgi:uncharacterized protein (DUF433 family)